MPPERTSKKASAPRKRPSGCVALSTEMVELKKPGPQTCFPVGPRLVFIIQGMAPPKRSFGGRQGDKT